MAICIVALVAIVGMILIAACFPYDRVYFSMPRCPWLD
jgi:hypothetical protein